VAQENSSSPYSFLGIGTKAFRGTVENRSMGGLGMLGDSIHLNLKNPAAYSDLKLTTFTAGATTNSVELESDSGSDNLDYFTLDYIAIGLPFNNLGVGFWNQTKKCSGL